MPLPLEGWGVGGGGGGEVVCHIAFCHVTSVLAYIHVDLYMNPTSKKLEGHIASGLLSVVHPSVRPSARSSRFLMHSITLKP